MGWDDQTFLSLGQSRTAGGQAFASQLSPLAPMGFGWSAPRTDSNKLEKPQMSRWRKCGGRSHGCAGVFFGCFAS